ncbi:MAG: FHA domain-containing protein [Oscillospiraceae bacterium]|nr:FHA domain-containing protein [Oscillospiraceae bacterium]
MTKKGFPAAFVAVMLLLSLLLGMGAGAEEYVFTTEETAETENVYVGQLQERLTELGYYTGDQTMLYDAATQYAVYHFCLVNGLTYFSQGVTTEVWNAILSDSAAALESEAEVYQDIAYGETGSAVLTLQTRLKELSYYTDGAELDPGVFDAGTQKAVETFCQVNQVTYSGTGASAAVQYIIYSDGAISYTDRDKGSLSQRLSSYMTGTVSVFGGEVPVFLLWICSVILVVLILVLCIFFFVPGKDRQPPGQQQTPVYWRKSGALRDDASVLTQGKTHDTSKAVMDVQIRFQDQVKNIQCPCSGTVTIGHGGCSIPLDNRDGTVSHSHCELYYRGAILMLRDHSTNGTFVNGRLVHNAECRVYSGTQLTVGRHELYIQF